jgi:hypothetical protein
MQDHKVNGNKHSLILICILLSLGLTTNEMWGHIYLSGEETEINGRGNPMR